MGQKRIETTMVKNILQDAPNVYLSEIIEKDDIKQQRLVALLDSYGFTTTNHLRELNDAELIDQDFFGPGKLEKLVKILTAWKENGFIVTENKDITEDVTKPETIIANLQKKVFLNYNNVTILTMRWHLKTFEEIAEYFNRSKQIISDREIRVAKRFVKWYKENRFFEKIGSYDDFQTYCCNNISNDQHELIDAVKRLVSIVK